MIPSRYVLVVMGFWGFFCAYSLRVILNVAIVAMVRESLVQDQLNSNQSIFTCPELLPQTFGFYNASVNNLSVELNGEFEWDANIQGLVLSSFYYGYFITQIPGGVISEKFGAKWPFGIGLLFTSVLSLIIPLAARWNVWALVAARVLQGLGEGVSYPAFSSMIGRWAPKHEISRLAAISANGAYIGIVVSLYISGLLSNSDFLGGWSSTFYVFGGLGCIWFVFWSLLVYDSPFTHPRISQEELLYIQRGMDGNQPQRIPVPWKSIFTSPCVWGLIITHIGSNWGFYTLLTDMPTYLSNVLHYDVATNGTLSAVSNLLPVFTTILSSVIADKLILDGRLTITTVRKVINSIGLYIPCLCMLIISFVGCQQVVILVCLAIALGTNGFTQSGFLVTHVHLSPELAGTLMGITNCFANLPGFLAPSIVGYLIQDGSTVENWRKVFLLTAAIFFVSGTAYNVLCNAKRQPWGTTQETVDKLNVSKNESSNPVPEDLRFKLPSET